MKNVITTEEKIYLIEKVMMEGSINYSMAEKLILNNYDINN